MIFLQFKPTFSGDSLKKMIISHFLTDLDKKQDDLTLWIPNTKFHFFIFAPNYSCANQ